MGKHAKTLRLMVDPTKGRGGGSPLEAELLFQIQAAGLPQPLLEFRFCLPRKWRFDFCWPAARVAVEAEGGVWVNGRHNRGQGFENDLEKYNQATLAGWRVLRFSAKMIRSGEALTVLERALRESHPA